VEFFHDKFGAPRRPARDRRIGKRACRLGTEPETALSNARVLPDGHLTGELSGDLGTEDLKRYAYKLFPYLKQRGEVLNGGLTAGSNDGKRARFELAHWGGIEKATQSTIN